MRQKSSVSISGEQAVNGTAGLKVWPRLVMHMQGAVRARFHGVKMGRATAWALESTGGGAAECGRLVRESSSDPSTMMLVLAIRPTTEYRHVGKVANMTFGSMLLIDADAGYSIESVLPCQGTLLRLPKSALGNRLELVSANAGRFFCADDPKVSAVHDALLSLIAAAPSMSPMESVEAYQGTLHLLDLLLRDGRSEADQSARFFELAISVIEAHLGEPRLDTEFIARELRVSRRHLEGVFASRGVTVMGSIWDRRVDRAADILTVDHLSQLALAEVGHACGFSSQAHFSRRFSQRFALSPGAYRRRHVERHGGFLASLQATD